MNKYELATHHTRSVLDEWLVNESGFHDIVARKIVDRLVSQGVIQSTDPEDLIDARTEERG